MFYKKRLILIISLLFALFTVISYISGNLIAFEKDPDTRWLKKASINGIIGYKIVIPEEVKPNIVGGPFQRSFHRWGPDEIEKKLTIIPGDGIPEVTSPGFDKTTDQVLIFYDIDSLKKYGSRPYYSIIIYGGKGLELNEIEERYSKEIGDTGVYLARIPTNYDVEQLGLYKVYIQAPPPEKTYEVTWRSKVEVKNNPDCDC
jgi:hypothetical protein